MLGSLDFDRLFLLLVAALVVLGPERLPAAIQWVSRILRQARDQIRPTGAMAARSSSAVAGCSGWPAAPAWWQLPRFIVCAKLRYSSRHVWRWLYGSTSGCGTR
jgi:hypothetical protein